MLCLATFKPDSPSTREITALSMAGPLPCPGSFLEVLLGFQATQAQANVLMNHVAFEPEFSALGFGMTPMETKEPFKEMSEKFTPVMNAH